MKTTRLFIILFFSTVFFGCKTTKEIQYIPLESIRTEIRDNYLRDSIYIHDSIYVRNSGDTVWVEKYSYKYIDRIKQDSIHIQDSIPVPYPVEIFKFVNKITWWQQTKMYAGVILFIIISAFFIFKIVKIKFFS